MKKKTRNASGRMSIPLILVGVGALLVIGVLIYVIAQNAPKSAAAPQAAGQEIPVEQIQRVSLADAKAAFDSKTAVFLDVRDGQSYAAGHIPGAINIPLAQLESRTNELKPDKWIITYCTWPAEESSARAAQIMLARGFKRVEPILGGFKAWEDAGYPVQQ